VGCEKERQKKNRNQIHEKRIMNYKQRWEIICRENERRQDNQKERATVLQRIQPLWKKMHVFTFISYCGTVKSYKTLVRIPTAVNDSFDRFSPFWIRGSWNCGLFRTHNFINHKSSPWRWRQHSPPKRWYPTKKTTRRHNPEDNSLNLHHITL